MQQNNKKNEFYAKFLEGFCDRLRKSRKTKQLSMATLAEIVGFSSSSQISRYENGENFPDPFVLLKISKALDIDLHWLITGHHSKIESHSKLAQMALHHISVNLDQFIKKTERAVHFINVLSSKEQSEKVNLKLDNLKKELPRYGQRLQEIIGDLNFVNEIIKSQSENSTNDNQ